MSTFGNSFAGNSNPNKSTEVGCWEVSRNGTSISSQLKASISHDQPVLCSSWKDDGTTVFSGGCDKMWPLGGSQPVTVAMHDAPIKEMAWIPEMNLLVTGSLDKTLRYWDLRQQTPVHTQQLPDRCYALSVRYPLMVVGTADKNLIMFNLQNPRAEFKRITSPLKYQTRCVAAFPDQQGFLITGIISTPSILAESSKFPERLDQLKDELVSITLMTSNQVKTSPLNATEVEMTHTPSTHLSFTLGHSVVSGAPHFASAGSDGSFSFWDKDSKQRLKVGARCNQPIPCNAFNNDGSIYAYAVCYDWHKGAVNHGPSQAKTNILLHLPQEAEVKPKPKIGNGRKSSFFLHMITGDKKMIRVPRVSPKLKAIRR